MVRLRPLPAAADDPPAGADEPHAVRASGTAAAIATAAASRLVFMIGGSFVDAPLGIHCGPGGVGAPPGSGALERPSYLSCPPSKPGQDCCGHANRFDSVSKMSGELRLQRTSFLMALAFR